MRRFVLVPDALAEEEVVDDLDELGRELDGNGDQDLVALAPFQRAYLAIGGELVDLEIQLRGARLALREAGR